MRPFHRVTTAAFILLAAPPALAQQAPRYSGQAILGMAVRPVPAQVAAATDGFQVLARGGLRLRPFLHLVTEFSLATFADEPRIVPILCPAPGPCPSALHTIPGLGVAGLALGLQPRIEAGPLEVFATATAGGYWLYHHVSGLPAAAPGARVTFGLGLPVGARVHILLEGSALQLLRQGLHEAETRHLGIGVALN